MSIQTQRQRKKSHGNRENRAEAAAIFEDALMRQLVMGLRGNAKDACSTIMDGAKSLKETKLKMGNIVSAHIGFVLRMHEEYRLGRM